MVNTTIVGGYQKHATFGLFADSVLGQLPLWPAVIWEVEHRKYYDCVCSEITILWSPLKTRSKTKLK